MSGPLKNTATTQAELQIDLPEAELDDSVAVDVSDPGVLVSLKRNSVAQTAFTTGDAGPGAHFAPRDEAAIPQIYQES